MLRSACSRMVLLSSRVAGSPGGLRQRTQLARLALFVAAALVALAALQAAGAATAGAAVWPQGHLLALDGAAGDQLGGAVAVSGDVAVVGAHSNDSNKGSAYVFRRANGVWQQEAKLTASDGAAGDYFGRAVAISGDTIVVGAFNHTWDGHTAAGQAYVFTRVNGVWEEKPPLRPSDPHDACYFGRSVAIDGDTILVGSPAHNTDAGVTTGAGQAYVFVRNAGVWTPQETPLTADDSAVWAEFGSSVAVAGNTAVVGARGDDTPAGADRGSAYVFTRLGTVWTQQKKLVDTDGAANDYFGCSVDLSGDTAIVGAPYKTIDGQSSAGSAYVFVRGTGDWEQQGDGLLAPVPDGSDNFGQSVALDGDTAIVGAGNDDNAGGNFAGASYSFSRTGTSWALQDTRFAPDGAAADYFGTAVDVAGATFVVGAFGDDTVAGANAGSAYVFAPDGTPPATSAALAPAANAAGWYKAAPVTVTLSATDELSGVASTEFRLAGAAGWTPYTAPFTVTGAGSSTYEYRSTDAAGNAETPKTVTVRIDDAAPATTVLALNANAAGWCKSPATVTMTAGDGLSGPGSTEYRLAGAAAWTPYAGPFVAGRQGSSTYEYRSTDLAGNVETAQTLTVKLDSAKPTTKAYAASVVKGAKVKLGHKVIDALPGCGKAAVTLRVYKGRTLKKTIKVPGTCACNAKKSYSWRCTLAKGSYTIKVYAKDIAGNAQRRVGSATLTVR